jgi:hypothetical protein
MLDRYVDMTIDGDRDLSRAPENVRPALRDSKKEEKRGSEPYKTSLERCKREITRGEFDCAMKAPSANEWEACID